MLGYRVEGSDTSETSVRRAGREAFARGLAVGFRVDDMRTLLTANINAYAAVIAMDNAIPHLQSDDEVKALTNKHAHAFASGRHSSHQLAGLCSSARTTFNQHAALFLHGRRFRRMVHQIWDWQGDRRYIVHLFITTEQQDSWRTLHLLGHYRAVVPNEVAELADRAGFDDVRILAPRETGYYQPIIRGVAP